MSAGSPAVRTRVAHPLLRRTPWLPVLVAITIAAVVVAVASGAGIVAALFAPATALLLAGAARVLPPRLSVANPLQDREPARLLAETRPLLVYALAFPLLLVPVVAWQRVQYLPLFPGVTASWTTSWNYLVAGKIGLLLLPAAWFAHRLGGDLRTMGVRGVAGAWRWVGPAAVGLLFLALSGLDVVGAAVPAFSPGRALAAVAVALLAAGVAEELFYRVLLQTRLEVLLGRWNGIALASLLFALLHVPSRFAFVYLGRTGSPAADLGLTVLAMIATKGAVGVLLGYLWSRYRNAWVNVAVHTAADSVVLVLLASGAAVAGS